MLNYPFYGICLGPCAKSPCPSYKVCLTKLEHKQAHLKNLGSYVLAFTVCVGGCLMGRLPYCLHACYDLHISVVIEHTTHQPNIY